MKKSKGVQPAWYGKIKGYLLPAVLILLLAAGVLILGGSKNDRVREVGGLVVTPPEGYVLSSSDSRYASWKYTGKEKKPGWLILDAEIKDDLADCFTTADEVFVKCDWMADKEMYVNPHGIRMVRGFTNISGKTERRYYVECGGPVFLLSMIEDERYYSAADCEEAMRETADNIRPKK